ncbi:MAG: hypothetical protein KBA61_00625 [Spirochaetes bacterium]|nr:hypothetical protein [Spirochaetota bacterium]
MAETNQFNALNETTRLIKIALKYTGGDMEKAKQMVNGQLNDVAITKGRFSVGGHTYGVFLVFFNLANNYIMNLNSLLTPSKSLNDKISINDGWKFFYSKFKEVVNEEAETSKTAGSSYEFTQHLIASLNGYGVFNYVAENNIEAVTDILREIIEKYYNRDEAQCQIDFERTSSLNLELAGIPLEEPSSARVAAPSETSPSEPESLITQIEKDAEHVITGRVIVSPVKGKYINDIQQGDKIRILLTDKNDTISEKVASAQKAVTTEGEWLPVKARVKAKIPLTEGGFMIYGVVAKNILARVVEEENVKIEMDSTPRAEAVKETDSQTMLYIAVLIAALFIALMVIVLLIQ